MILLRCVVPKNIQEIPLRNSKYMMINKEENDNDRRYLSNK